MIVKTNISIGYKSFIEDFMKANELLVLVTENADSKKLELEYQDDSDTAHQIMFMSIRHLGFENMLCDFLKRCGIPTSLIAIGQAPAKKRDLDQLDRDWEVYKKEHLGFR